MTVVKSGLLGRQWALAQYNIYYKNTSNQKIYLCIQCSLKLYVSLKSNKCAE